MPKNEFDQNHILKDEFYTQNYIASVYNIYVSGCRSEQVQDVLMEILTEEHEIEFEILNEIGKRTGLMNFKKE